MKVRWKLLLACIALPLVVGGLAAFLTRGSMTVFASLETPPLSPPGWVFPAVWTVLYILMGIASYLVLTADAPSSEKISAIAVYLIQLALNFIWPIVFFRMGMYLPAFAVIVALWIMIAFTAALFFRVSKIAGYLIIPYLFWVTFAAYLNLGVYFLN